ncbi:Alpha/Beta hydrolase protein [Baffinella frigidus]|nr:Alpha/Beta hydrolase protein [Cryptophyta sp. CCMP2293]
MPESQVSQNIHRQLESLNPTSDVCRNAEALGVDRNNVSMGGCSAGGLIAAVMHRHCAEQGIPLRCAVLFAPMLSYLPANDSWREFRHAKLLSPERMTWFWRCYCAPEDASNAKCCPPAGLPLRGVSPSAFAPLVVVTNTLDILRSEGDEYAAAMAEQGVPTIHLPPHPGMHWVGFMAKKDVKAIAAWEKFVFPP